MYCARVAEAPCAYIRVALPAEPSEVPRKVMATMAERSATRTKRTVALVDAERRNERARTTRSVAELAANAIGAGRVVMATGGMAATGSSTAGGGGVGVRRGSGAGSSTGGSTAFPRRERPAARPGGAPTGAPVKVPCPASELS